MVWRNSARLPRNGSVTRRFRKSVAPSSPSGGSERQDVGLFEIDVGRVDEQRNPHADIVPELERQRIVARLGVGERDRREVRLGRIVVQVDVRALEHAPVESAVLDLVLVEREELCRRAPERHEQRARQEGHDVHFMSSSPANGADQIALRDAEQRADISG